MVAAATPELVPIASLSESGSQDFVLRFFDNCPRYTREVKQGSAAMAESNAYLAKVTPAIAKRVAEKTGLPAAELLKPGIVSAMWSACQSEFNVLGDLSRWCSVFEEEDVLALEYVDDLDCFYTRGPGIPIAYLDSAPLLTDIVAHMDSAVKATESQQPYVRASLRFGHAETVLPFSALLGLFHEDAPLTANMSAAAIAARKWRFGTVSPMAANVQLALYRCGTDRQPFVELLHNEVPVNVPNCSNSNGSKLCSFTDFKTLFKSILSLDWDSLCERKKMH
jgi:hypothetical protein